MIEMDEDDFISRSIFNGTKIAWRFMSNVAIRSFLVFLPFLGFLSYLSITAYHPITNLSLETQIILPLFSLSYTIIFFAWAFFILCIDNPIKLARKLIKMAKEDD